MRGHVLWQDEQAEKNWIGSAAVRSDRTSELVHPTRRWKDVYDSVKQLEVEAAAALQPMPGMRPSAVQKGYDPCTAT